MAKKYFGDENPLGKTLNVNGTLDVQVTGVMRDVPLQSSLKFDCIVPFVLMFAPSFREPEHWGGNPFQTFVRLHKNYDSKAVAAKITALAEKYDRPETVKRFLRLHPLERLHLHTPEGNGSFSTLVVFSVIALFVLVIACINFMSLSTAKASTRAREVGMRKVIGARRRDLIIQFIGESLLLSLMTLCLSLLLLVLFLPTFNRLIEKQLPLNSLLEPGIIIGFLVLTLFTGFLSGSYPAFYLSSFQPAAIFRNLSRSGTKSASFRKALVLIQFSLLILLIICTTMVFKQLNYLLNRNLGFDKNNLVSLALSDGLKKSYDSLKSELERNPDVLGVTKSLQHPANIGSTVSALSWQGKDPGMNVSFNWDYIGYDYFKTFDLKLIDGRAFSVDHPSDLRDAYVVNESAVKFMGLDSPVGQRFSAFRNEGRIIGVVRDVHFQPLYFPIKPFVYILKPDVSSFIFVRLHSGDMGNTLAYLENMFKKFDPHYPFHPVFFDDVLKNHIYTNEKRMGNVSGYFTLLAVAIACLGLFGLAAFTAEQRTKEIGIRKVMGASVWSILVMLWKSFSKWILIANLFSWPAAYFILRGMLSKYAYRSPMGLEIFLLSGLSALLIALLTVSYQALKAARENPVDSLKYE
jgi:putative ABC transport system permease protein